MNTPPHLPTLLLSTGALLLVACDQQKPQGSDAQQGDETVTYSSNDSSDLSAPNAPTGYTKQYQDILAKVNAQCPDEYPEIVTPLPDEHELKAMDARTLIGLLDSWNPVLRMEAAKELGTRGKQAIGELRQGTHSENDKVRAGSATALAAIAKSVPTEELPADLATDFIRLSTDEEHEVRVAALNALSTINPKTKETTMAVLAMCTDENEYLAQDAKVALNKYFEAHKLPIEDIEAGLKAAMSGPLPNGRGHIVNIVTRLKPKDQRRFIPELLAHLDWWPDRDTMFAAGGQAEAIELLTKLGETQLIERLPKLMNKINRGEGLFSVCLKSARDFGADAKVIVPELKAIYKDLEKNGKNAKVVPRGDLKAGIDEVRQTYIEIDSL